MSSNAQFNWNTRFYSTSLDISRTTPEMTQLFIWETWSRFYSTLYFENFSYLNIQFDSSRLLSKRCKLIKPTGGVGVDCMNTIFITSPPFLQHPHHKTWAFLFLSLPHPLSPLSLTHTLKKALFILSHFPNSHLFSLSPISIFALPLSPISSSSLYFSRSPSICLSLSTFVSFSLSFNSLSLTIFLLYFKLTAILVLHSNLLDFLCFKPLRQSCTSV